MKTEMLAIMKITDAFLVCAMAEDSWGPSVPRNAGRIISIIREVGNEFGLTEETPSLGRADCSDAFILHPSGTTGHDQAFHEPFITLETGETLDSDSQIDWFLTYCENPHSREFERAFRKLLTRYSK